MIGLVHKNMIVLWDVMWLVHLITLIGSINEGSIIEDFLSSLSLDEGGSELLVGEFGSSQK